MRYIKAIRDIDFVKTGNIYEVHHYDMLSKAVIIRNEDRTSPMIWREFPLDAFEIVVADVIMVDFKSRKRVA